jgi:hypothetical protein
VGSRWRHRRGLRALSLYAELRDFRGSWRYARLVHVADEWGLTREAVTRAWGMIWMDFWWSALRRARRERGLRHWDVDDPDEE